MAIVSSFRYSYVWVLMASVQPVDLGIYVKVGECFPTNRSDRHDPMDVVLGYVCCNVMFSVYPVCVSCLSSLCLLVIPLMSICCLGMSVSVLFGLLLHILIICQLVWCCMSMFMLVLRCIWVHDTSLCWHCRYMWRTKDWLSIIYYVII